LNVATMKMLSDGSGSGSIEGALTAIASAAKRSDKFDASVTKVVTEYMKKVDITDSLQICQFLLSVSSGMQDN